MRLINATPIIKFIENGMNNPNRAEAFGSDATEILAEIMIAPTINPEDLRPQWISVEDRLPEVGKRILATDGAFVGEFYINKAGQWRRYNVNCHELLMALDILWWMPFPQPPIDYAISQTGNAVCERREGNHD